MTRTTREEAEALAANYTTDYPDDGPVALMAEDYIALLDEVERLKGDVEQLRTELQWWLDDGNRRVARAALHRATEAADDDV